jgi:hypothetical protein
MRVRTGRFNEDEQARPISSSDSKLLEHRFWKKFDVYATKSLLRSAMIRNEFGSTMLRYNLPLDRGL